jgi:Lon protease-like protein
MDAVPDKILSPLPASVPVMVLGGAALLPHNCLPLCIFEPRYRAMLEKALETDRLIAIATPGDRSGTQVLSVGCVGLVRASVRNEDGTSRLILEGLCRVRFTGWPQMEPFRQAELRVHGSPSSTNPSELEERLEFLRAALRRFGPGLPSELSARMAQINHPDVLLDVVAGVLLSDEAHRQAILEEADGVMRQRLLLRLLGEIAPS